MGWLPVGIMLYHEDDGSQLGIVVGTMKMMSSIGIMLYHEDDGSQWDNAVP